MNPSQPVLRAIAPWSEPGDPIWFDIIPYPSSWKPYWNGVFCNVMQGPCDCGNFHTEDEWELDYTIHDATGRCVFNSPDREKRDKANEYWKGTTGSQMTSRRGLYNDPREPEDPTDPPNKRR